MLRGVDLIGGAVVEVSPPLDMSGNMALVTMIWDPLPAGRIGRQAQGQALTDASRHRRRVQHEAGHPDVRRDAI